MFFPFAFEIKFLVIERVFYMELSWSYKHVQVEFSAEKGVIKNASNCPFFSWRRVLLCNHWFTYNDTIPKYTIRLLLQQVIRQCLWTRLLWKFYLSWCCRRTRPCRWCPTGRSSPRPSACAGWESCQPSGRRSW